MKAAVSGLVARQGRCSAQCTRRSALREHEVGVRAGALNSVLLRVPLHDRGWGLSASPAATQAATALRRRARQTPPRLHCVWRAPRHGPRSLSHRRPLVVLLSATFTGRAGRAGRRRNNARASTRGAPARRQVVHRATRTFFARDGDMAAVMNVPARMRPAPRLAATSSRCASLSPVRFALRLGASPSLGAACAPGTLELANEVRR